MKTLLITLSALSLAASALAADPAKKAVETKKNVATNKTAVAKKPVEEKIDPLYQKIVQHPMMAQLRARMVLALRQGDT